MRCPEQWMGAYGKALPGMKREMREMKCIFLTQMFGCHIHSEMTTRLFFAALTLCALPALALDGDDLYQSRLWTNASGKTLTATFVRYNAAKEKVSLKLGRGRQVEIPLSSLSESDVDWVKAHVPEAMDNQERMKLLTEGRLGKVTSIPETDAYPQAFVYYPSTLDADNPPPIIILFNSVGHGQHMAQKFKEACEANGWVALGFNTFRNSNNKELSASLNQLWTSTNANLEKMAFFDPDRMYMGGISGGASRAFTYSERRIPPIRSWKGIVSMGGWLGGRDRLECPTKMTVAVINGDKDGGANGWVTHDAKVLKKRKCVIKEFPFPGGHEMPPDKHLVEVLKWMKEASPETSEQRLPSPEKEG